jgi:hypothetical protein
MIPGHGQCHAQGGVGAAAYPSEADLIPKVVEAPDAVLGILEVMVLDEAEPMTMSVHGREYAQR